MKHYFPTGRRNHGRPLKTSGYMRLEWVNKWPNSMRYMIKMRSHFFTKLSVPTNLPQVFCTVFYITGRWPGQPKNVIANAANFSCEGFTGTYDGRNAQS
jgi:hypothetical protein